MLYNNATEMFHSWLKRKIQIENHISIYSLSKEYIEQILNVMEGSIQGKVSQGKVFNKLYFYVVNNIDFNEYSWLERISVNGTCITKENLQKQYGNEIGIEKWNQYIKKQSFHMSEQYFINKLGEEEGRKFWKKYCDRQAYTCSKEYFKEKFNINDEEFKSYNKNRACTKDNMIKRYGEEEGLKRWKKYCDRQAYTNTEEYFINKLGEEEGRKKYIEINFLKKHTLESYIKKLGEEEGRKKYIEYVDKMQKISSQKPLYYSLSSQVLFRYLYEKLKDKFNNIHFATLDGEFYLIDNSLKKIYFYDFVIEDIKLCIEYNGDIFHANPKQYNPNDIPPFRGNTKTALEIWKQDNNKLDILKKHDYNIITIWESDYISNRDLMNEKILKEIEKYEYRNN